MDLLNSKGAGSFYNHEAILKHKKAFAFIILDTGKHKYRYYNNSVTEKDTVPLKYNVAHARDFLSSHKRVSSRPTSLH